MLLQLSTMQLNADNILRLMQAVTCSLKIIIHPINKYKYAIVFNHEQ